MPVSSISATFSHCCQCAPMENWPTSRSMLRPASGFLVPWHSKQYFWNVTGGTDAEEATGAGRLDLASGTGRGAVVAGGDAGAGDCAERIDASPTTAARQTPERVMKLQVWKAGRGGKYCNGK